MAEIENKSFALPWGPLLILLTTLAGLTALLPTKTARPPASGIEATLRENKGVSARLWQDPLQIACESEARRTKENANYKTAPASTLGDWSDLQEEYTALTHSGITPQVLMVCVSGSPYAEDVERRLRDRAAVLCRRSPKVHHLMVTC